MPYASGIASRRPEVRVGKVKSGDVVLVRSPEAASSLDDLPPAGGVGGVAAAADPLLKVRLNRDFLRGGAFSVSTSN